MRWVDEGDRSPFPPEEFYTRQFADFFKQTGIADYQSPKAMTLTEVQETLRRVQSETGVNPALLYVTFMPDRMDARTRARISDKECLAPPEEPNAFSPKLSDLNITALPDYCDILELTLVTADGKPTYIRVEGQDGKYIRRNQVEGQAKTFYELVSDIDPNNRTRYVNVSQRLYNWIIQPVSKSLDSQKIKNITFVLPQELRKLPFAALANARDGYIINSYSVGLMPSLSLTDTKRTRITDNQVLPIGASKFISPPKRPLNEVPKEIANIAELWKADSRNLDLDVEEVRKKLSSPNGFGIIHLATHASFDNDGIGTIFFKNGTISLNDIRTYNWRNPIVDMLVLSACETSKGNEKYELGFAGSAARVGVKSVVGSLWQTSDEGSRIFMEKFYRDLKLSSTPIKAESLRLTQFNLSKNPQNSHPYYWSTFTLIGNPW